MSTKEIQDRIDNLKSKITDMEKQKGVSIMTSQPSKIGAGSDERRLLNSFGASDVKGLLATNVCDSRYNGVPLESKLAVIGLKSRVDIARWSAQMFQGDALDKGDLDSDAQLAKCKGFFQTRYARETDLQGVLKSFGSTTASEGDEWVPTMISSNYVEEYELERKIASAFKELPMTSNPWQLPIQTSVKKSRIIGEGADATSIAQNFGTNKISFDAKKLASYFILPEELNEDSAPAILELGRAEVIKEQARSVEDSILNGMLSGAMDSDIGGSSDNRKAWDGLRYLALGNSSTQSFSGAGVTKANLDAMRKKGGKHFVNPKELAWVVGSSGYSQMLSIDEIATLEKFGPMATVLTGAAGIFRGIPIMVSEFVREDLNASGVYDGITQTMTCVYLVNTTRFYLGRRRPIRVKVQQDARPEFDRWQLASYQRLDFKGHPQSATEKSVVLGINVLK